MIFFLKLENRITLICKHSFIFFPNSLPCDPPTETFLSLSPTFHADVFHACPQFHTHARFTCRSGHEPIISRAAEHSPSAGGEGGHLGMCTRDLSFISSPQIDMFVLGYSLEVKIKVFRLFKFNSRDFEVCYPEESLREWPEISLLTENDRHYHIPVF